MTFNSFCCYLLESFFVKVLKNIESPVIFFPFFPYNSKRKLKSSKEKQTASLWKEHFW